MKHTLTFALLILATAALPARGQVDDITRYDLHPLIQLHLNGADFIGRPFQGDVFIYRGGPTFLSYKGANGADVRSESAVATPEQLAALGQALARARVGQQRGNCGSPAPDFVSRYALTWYGKQRVRTIPVGGDFSTCPAEVIEIYDATCEFIGSVLGPQIEVCVPPNP
jgi:hypothetical protein